MITILHVEDSNFCLRNIQRILKGWAVDNKVIAARDGIYAYDMLGMDDPAAQTCFPDLVLLDLKMPRMGGIEFLETLRAQDRFDRLPVIISTTSDNPQDIGFAEDLMVDAYLIKGAPPVTIIETIETVLSKRHDPAT